MTLRILLLLGFLACAWGDARSAPAQGLAEPDPPAAPGPTRPTVTAIVHATVLPMTGDGPIEDHAVLVEGDRIVRVGPTASLEIPAGATVVDAAGRWVIPGLVDAHVHLEREDLPSYVRHGVTTVRNMWGFPDVWRMKAETESGETLGPTIHTVSSGIDGTPPSWPLTQFVTDPSQADSVVALQAANGYTTLKIYQNLTRESYDAVVAAARARGMDFVGHVPTRVGLERVLEAGQRSLAHLGGFESLLAPDGGRGLAAWARIDVDRIPFVAAAVRGVGATVVPTQAIVSRMQRGLPPLVRGEGLQNRRRVLRALHEAGVPVLAGTDSGIGVTEPGASMVDEIEELHAAGLSTREALAAGTADVAAFLGGADAFGTIAPGLRADLLLLPADPLDDLDALRRPDGVMLRGSWVVGP